MAINKISATTIQKLRDKSVEKLPTVVKNVTPTDLKKKFTGIVVDDKDSIIEEVNRIVDEINDEFQNIINVYSEYEFSNITREEGKLYAVYNETTGVITWYYGNVGISN